MYKVKRYISEYFCNIFMSLALKIIRHYAKDSNYIRYANTEYKYAWPNYKEDDMQSFMCQQVNDILALLASQEDSGISIGYKLSLLNKLIKFKPLTKLSFDDSEFGHAYKEVYQNKRDSSIFREGGKYDYLNSFIKKDIFYISEESEIIKKDGGTWTGGIYIIPKEGDIYYLRKDWIKDITTFSNQEFIIPTYALEFPKGWWLSFCKEEDLDEYKKVYDFEKDYTELEVEIGDNFKHGIYKQSILDRITIIKEHMYGSNI